jgi:very-short-patch-repair endonuclease
LWGGIKGGGKAVPTATKPESIARARKLRRNMTNGEKRLWSELREFRRHYGLHVRKQAPIGPYIVDFVVHERRLVIEVDGEHHELPEQRSRDARRDGWLAQQGYQVVKLKTGELADAFEGCVAEILHVAGLLR